jgi:hypothetical protein
MAFLSWGRRVRPVFFDLGVRVGVPVGFVGRDSAELAASRCTDHA